MDNVKIGSFGNKSVYVEPDGGIHLYFNNGHIQLSVEEASRMVALMIKGIAHSQNETVKAMGLVPEAVKDMKKTSQEAKQVTDRFSELAEGS